MTMLTQERLKELLNYNPETGIFTWIGKSGVRSHIKLGDIAGSISNGYLQISISNKIYKSHRLAWLYMTGKFPENQIDHIDLVKSNNKFSNLRDVSNSENLQNIKTRKKHNKSGYLGVCKTKQTKKFKASITLRGKSIHIGYFSSACDAHHAYVEYKRIIHQTCTI